MTSAARNVGSENKKPMPDVLEAFNRIKCTEKPKVQNNSSKEIHNMESCQERKRNERIWRICKIIPAGKSFSCFFR